MPSFVGRESTKLKITGLEVIFNYANTLCLD